jgi:site-specific DNA-methyltransferase (adenine-specific)
MLDMSRNWTDADLYRLHKLTSEEVAYIEKTIGDRDWIDALDSPVPFTHLPGGRKYKAGEAPVEADEDEDDE